MGQPFKILLLHSSLRGSATRRAQGIARCAEIAVRQTIIRIEMSPTAAAKKRAFDPDSFLATIGRGRKSLAFARKKRIYTQGDAADAVFYIQRGKVRLTVVSKTGKEATIGIL